MLRNLLKGFGRRRSSGDTRRPNHRALRLGVEPLEQRKLLAIDCSVSAPLDGGASDLDPLDDAVQVVAEQGYFELKLTDGTYGVDDSSVSKTNLTLAKNGTVLTEGASEDYSFSYNGTLDVITLTSEGGDFGIGKYVVNFSGAKNNNNETMTPAEFRVQIGRIKNVILMIGDGMGYAQIEVTRQYKGEDLFFEDTSNFPQTASVITDFDGSGATDSAAAATAMATGVEVGKEVISYVEPPVGDLKTSLEIHADAGKRTGLVTTAYISHATPAAFGAHEPSRYNYDNIIDDYLNQDPLINVLMGAAEHVEPGDVDEYYTVVENEEDMWDLNTETEDHVWGQFNKPGEEYMPYYYDDKWPPNGLYYTDTLPRLFEMTEVTRDILDEDSDGFFVMVEGGRIDHACHANNVVKMVDEVLEFEKAVEEVHDWATTTAPTETLIIVTADHETGGLEWLGPSWDDVYWDKTVHTDADVPLFAWGVGAEIVSGTFANEFVYHLTTPDTNAPTADLITPDDGGSGDHDSDDGEVLVHSGQSSFVIQLNDEGRSTENKTEDSAAKGIDDYTVDAASITVTKNGTTLIEGTHYDFSYNSSTDRITLTPHGEETFGHGCYQIILNGGTSKITDLATPANELAETTFQVVIWEFVDGDLYLHGTPEADTITVSASSGKVTVNGEELDPSVNAADVTQLVVWGYDGDDVLDLSGVNTTTGFQALDYDVYVFGGRHDDTIIGSGFADGLLGEDGNDQISGGPGADRIFGQAGDDSLDGGADNDTYYFTGSANLGSDTITDTSGTADMLSFGGLSAGINVNIASTSQQTVASGKLVLTLNSGSAIERVYGTSYADTIRGNGLANYLTGGYGNDTLYGGSGNDTLYGGGGNDLIYGEAGNDTIRAGDGNDSAHGGSGDDLAYGDDACGAGYGGDDLLYGDSGNDTLYGDCGNLCTDGGDDYAYGGSGNDTLYGEGGNDYLFGQEDDDTLRGGYGNDGLYGDDSVAYGYGGDDILHGEEGNDNLYCDNGSRSSYGGDDYAYGGGGNDHMYGEGGQDTMDGGSGQDTIYGGFGDAYGYGDDLYGGSGNDTIYGDEGTGYGESDYIDGGSGDDYAYGEGGYDTLVGGAGNDYLDGGYAGDTYRFTGTSDLGSDSIYEQSDSSGDSLYFYGFGYAVNVDISSTSQQTVASGKLVLTLASSTLIENVYGTNHADTITGNSDANSIYGYGDNDTINGGVGNDYIFGGDGNDTLRGGGDDDWIWGGAGNDWIYGEAGHDTIFGDAGNDKIWGGSGNDTLRDDTYGSDVDEVYGESGDDTIDIEDGDGDDTADGGSGSDTCDYDVGDTVTNCEG